MTQFVKLVKSFVAERIGNEAHSTAMCESAHGKSQAPATILNDVGNDWRCWRLKREPDRNFAHRLALHLSTVLIAAEDDLKLVLATGSHLQQRNPDDEPNPQ